MSISVQPVIMAGGSGTRLWPLSRAGFPKQFLVLSGNSSLFQQAATRLQGLDGGGVGGGRAADRRQRGAPLPGARPAARSADRTGRRGAGARRPQHRAGADAGRAAGAGTRHRPGAGGDLVGPDRDRRGRLHAPRCSARCEVAADGAITILGITPDRPETGYGYIRTEAAAPAAPRCTWRSSSRSPTSPPPQRYLAAGGYFWNAGMFVLKASVWMAALERFRPDIAASLPRRLGRAQHRPALRAPGQGRVRRRAVGVGRLRGDGEVPGQRLRHPHGGAGRRLERPRRLGSRVAGGAQGRARQRRGRRRHRQGQPQHAGARHQPARQRRRARPT